MCYSYACLQRGVYAGVERDLLQGVANGFLQAITEEKELEMDRSKMAI